MVPPCISVGVHRGRMGVKIFGCFDFAAGGMDRCWLGAIPQVLLGFLLEMC